MVYTYHYDSPLGGITIASNGVELTGLWFDGQKYFGDTILEEPEERFLPVFEETTGWLDLYFSGKDPALHHLSAWRRRRFGKLSGRSY